MRGKKGCCKIQKVMTSTCENLAQRCLLLAGDVLGFFFSSLRYFTNQPLFLEIAFKCSACTRIWQQGTPAKTGHSDAFSSQAFAKHPLCETQKKNNWKLGVPCKLKETFLKVGNVLLLILLHLLNISEHDDNKFLASLKCWEPQLKASSRLLCYRPYAGSPARRVSNSLSAKLWLCHSFLHALEKRLNTLLQLFMDIGKAEKAESGRLVWEMSICCSRVFSFPCSNLSFPTRFLLSHKHHFLKVMTCCKIPFVKYSKRRKCHCL